MKYECSYCAAYGAQSDCRGCRFARVLTELEHHESLSMDDRDDRCTLADALETFIYKELASVGL